MTILPVLVSTSPGLLVVGQHAFMTHTHHNRFWCHNCTAFCVLHVHVHAAAVEEQWLSVLSMIVRGRWHVCAYHRYQSLFPNHQSTGFPNDNAVRASC